MLGVPIIKLNHLLIKPFYPVHKKYHEYVVYLCNFVTSNMFSGLPNTGHHQRVNYYASYFQVQSKYFWIQKEGIRMYK